MAILSIQEVSFSSDNEKVLLTGKPRWKTAWKTAGKTAGKSTAHRLSIDELSSDDEYRLYERRRTCRLGHEALLARSVGSTVCDLIDNTLLPSRKERLYFDVQYTPNVDKFYADSFGQLRLDQPAVRGGSSSAT